MISLLFVIAMDLRGEELRRELVRDIWTPAHLVHLHLSHFDLSASHTEHFED